MLRHALGPMALVVLGVAGLSVPLGVRAGDQPRREATARPSRPPAPATAALLPVAFDLAYHSRILVPAGSEIALTVSAPDGRVLASRRVLTAADAPPYRVQVVIPRGTAIRVDASLTSTIGHVFEETVRLDPGTTDLTRPIALVLRAR